MVSLTKHSQTEAIKKKSNATATHFLPLNLCYSKVNSTKKRSQGVQPVAIFWLPFHPDPSCVSLHPGPPSGLRLEPGACSACASWISRSLGGWRVQVCLLWEGVQFCDTLLGILLSILGILLVNSFCGGYSFLGSVCHKTQRQNHAENLPMKTPPPKPPCGGHGNLHLTSLRVPGEET